MNLSHLITKKFFNTSIVYQMVSLLNTTIGEGNSMIILILTNANFSIISSPPQTNPQIKPNLI